MKELVRIGKVEFISMLVSFIFVVVGIVKYENTKTLYELNEVGTNELFNMFLISIGLVGVFVIIVFCSYINIRRKLKKSIELLDEN